MSILLIYYLFQDNKLLIITCQTPCKIKLVITCTCICMPKDMRAISTTSNVQPNRETARRAIGLVVLCGTRYWSLNRKARGRSRDSFYLMKNF